MALSTIPKHPIGKPPPQRAVPLDRIDADALTRWWESMESPAQHERVLSLLDRLHASGSWLACGCTGNSDNPPLLAVARRSAGHGGNLSLRRMMDRAAHRPDCRFAFEQREREGEGGANPMSEGVGEAIRPDFLFHESSGMNDHRQRESTEREPSEGHSSNHPLARRMLWLLHEAKVNTWPRPYGTSDRKALLKLAEQIELAQGLFLRDVLYCDARAWREGWMESGFHKYQKHGLKPQVWWLCEIDQASQKEGFVRLAGATQTTRIDGKLAVYGGDGAAVRYPMLMCALVGKLTDGSVKILQAYAHPIQALDWWLPVDSNLERDAVDDLLGVMRWLARDKGVELELQKPLFSWNDTGARPDFVVSRRGQPSDCLVVETMGSDDLEYRERKARTVERLSGYQVFEDERARDPSGAGKLLRKAVARWALAGD